MTRMATVHTLDSFLENLDKIFPRTEKQRLADEKERLGSVPRKSCRRCHGTGDLGRDKFDRVIDCPCKSWGLTVGKEWPDERTRRMTEN